MPALKSINFDREDILMQHGYDPADNSLQVHVSLNEIEYNHEGDEDFLLPASDVDTRIERAGTLRVNDIDLTITIYRVE